MVAWETYWRLEGYEPGFEETKDLWALNRGRVGTGADAFVLIGSSRMNFDLDLDMWEQDWNGRRPVMPAKPGTCPRAYLTDSANYPEFKGTVLCGVTPVLFCVPDLLPPVGSAQENVDYFRTWSLVQKSGRLLSIPVESAFASINAEDLSLKQLIDRRWLPLSNRQSPLLIPPFPPYFGRIDLERRNHMWAKMERDPGLQAFVQQIWIPHWEHTPTLEGEGLDALLARIRSEVAMIQARGGEVVFLRLPFPRFFIW